MKVKKRAEMPGGVKALFQNHRRKGMKRIILDTDIGIDCDDAAAIGMLLQLEEEGKCFVEGITTSTTREGAVEAVRAIAQYYGKDKEIGSMREPGIFCDKENVYAKALKEHYGCSGDAQDAVEMLRRKLAQAKEKLTLIAIGPLTNIARLIKSEGDIYSDLNGTELLRKKADCLYIMGGSFKENYAPQGIAEEKEIIREWNILQDIESARYVMEKCTCPMVLCPFEAGNYVKTEMRAGENPVWYAMKTFADYEKCECGNGFTRESWDPVTCLAALEDCSAYFDLSDEGRITVSEDGETVFHPEEKGTARFLIVKGNYDGLAERINSLVRD